MNESQENTKENTLDICTTLALLEKDMVEKQSKSVYVILPSYGIRHDRYMNNCPMDTINFVLLHSCTLAYIENMVLRLFQRTTEAYLNTRGEVACVLTEIEEGVRYPSHILAQAARYLLNQKIPVLFTIYPKQQNNEFEMHVIFCSEPSPFTLGLTSEIKNSIGLVPYLYQKYKNGLGNFLGEMYA